MVSVEFVACRFSLTDKCQCNQVLTMIHVLQKMKFCERLLVQLHWADDAAASLLKDVATTAFVKSIDALNICTKISTSL